MGELFGIVGEHLKMVALEDLIQHIDQTIPIVARCHRHCRILSADTPGKLLRQLVLAHLAEHDTTLLCDRRQPRQRLVHICADRALVARRFLCDILQRRRAIIRLQLAQQLRQAQLLVNRRQRRHIRLVEGKIQRRKIDRHIAFDRRQLLRKQRVFLACQKLVVELFTLEVVEMGVKIFHRFIVIQELLRRLFTDAIDARNVVALVAHQPLHLDHPRRCETVVFRQILWRHDLHLLPLALWEADRHLLTHQLKQIAVAAEDDALTACCALVRAHRADDVVGFIALDAERLNVHIAQRFLDQRHLHQQILRHTGARALVVGIALVAEHLFRNIKGHKQRVRLETLNGRLQRVQKTVDSIRRHTLGVGQMRHPVKGTVGHAVSVYHQ